jgi:tetratricopeptide (TPR) repeat protein
MSVIPHFQPKTKGQYMLMMGILAVLTVGSAVGAVIWRFSGEDKSRRSAVIEKATTFHKRGMDDLAIEVLKASIQLEDQKGHGNDPALVHALDFLGALCQDRKRDAEAETAWRRALALRLRELGPDHPEVLDTSDKLAAALREQKKFDEAEKLLKKTLSKREEYRGSKDDPGLLGSINRLTGLYIAQGRWTDAETQARRAIGIGRATMGLVPPLLADSLSDLGTILTAQGRDEDAEPLLRRALAMREAVPDSKDEDTAKKKATDIASAQKTLAANLRKLGKEKEAKELESKAAPPSMPSVEK